MSLEYISCIYLTYNSYMSYLIRTGTGRNNISYGGGKSTKAKYLRRTGTGRNNISWIDINSNGTYNVLERTSTGRNNIRWYNTTFSFITTQSISEYIKSNCDSILINLRLNSSSSAYYYQSYRPTYNIQTSGSYNGMIRLPSSGTQRWNSDRDDSLQSRIDFTFTDSNSQANTFNTYLNTCPKLRLVQGTGDTSIVGDDTVTTNHYVRSGNYNDVVRCEISSIHAARTWSSNYGCFFLGFTK